MQAVEVIRGDGPVVLGMPHTGTWLPEEVAARLNDRGRELTDTDWHIDRLYNGLLADVTVVRATFHRYLIDANRPPDGASLYPGQNTTGLVPLTDFDGRPIWDQPPAEAEVEDRRKRWHSAYHAALGAELRRIGRLHGTVILYDCHSIRSNIPYLFDGTLPDFNIGTASGASCDPRIEEAVHGSCRATGRTTALNGRFKGGWTTRHYGKPGSGVHAIQMELAQSTHLSAEVAPYAYDEAKAATVRPVLAEILQTLAALAPSLKAPT